MIGTLEVMFGFVGANLVSLAPTTAPSGLGRFARHANQTPITTLEARAAGLGNGEASLTPTVGIDSRGAYGFTG